MKIRVAQLEELDRLQSIYTYARELMQQSGNPTQWPNGYPKKDLIQTDIEKGQCYVVEKDDEIAGVFVLALGEDPTYKVIEQGTWLNDRPYGTIHRLATAGHIKGVASFCIDWCFTVCHNIRIDTHEDNKAMQHILEQKGFKKCGIIYVKNGTPRIAYQKEGNE